MYLFTLHVTILLSIRKSNKKKCIQKNEKNKIKRKKKGYKIYERNSKRNDEVLVL